jgi:DNA-binding Lrp family transcriptional regulator
MRIVEMLVQNDKISISRIKDQFGVTRQMALKEVNKLTKLGVIKLKGKGRGAYYVLV